MEIQVPPESSTELAILTRNLQQVQHKIVNQWNGKGLDQYLQQRRLSHEQWLKEARDEVDTIKGQLMQLYKQSAQNKEVLLQKLQHRRRKQRRLSRLSGMLLRSDRRAEKEVVFEVQDDQLAIAAQKKKAEEIELAIRDASEKRQKLLFQKEQLSNEIREQWEVNQREKELLEAQQQATRSKLTELNKAEGFFKERMGLRFKKLDSDNLQFVFTDVDPKDHERVFYFTIKVVDKEYQVTDCSPEVPGQQEFLEQLNKSNNLMAFVVAMRQKFKLAC